MRDHSGQIIQGLLCNCDHCRRERRAKLNRLMWLDEQVAKLRADGMDAAAERLISRFDGPFCWQCEVIEGRGYCGCPIAANE